MLIAVGSYLAHDLRERDGITRSVLRRAAFRRALSRNELVRRSVTAYLRADPPRAAELTPRDLPITPLPLLLEAPGAAPAD